VPTGILGGISNFIPWIPSPQHKGWVRKGIFKRHFISFYAGTNIAEDFAETYRE